MKKIITLIAAIATIFAIHAQEALTIPHEASWHHKTDYIDNNGVFLDQNNIADLGKATTDQDKYYNLGGWTSIATGGDKPFYIPITGDAGARQEVSNTMECRSTNTINETSYMISPFINFSRNSLKTITLKCGKEILSMEKQLELIYSTDYAGDPSLATWNIIKTNLIPTEQVGLGDSKLAKITARIDLVTPRAVIAIRAVKNGNLASEENGKKIRISTFEIAEKSYGSKNGAITCSGEKWTAELISALNLSKATSLDITAIASGLTGLTLDPNMNPNCLIFANEALEGIKNVVVGNTAENITLTDGHDFHNIKEFTATTINYDRKLYKGWNTITFPFPYTVNGEQFEEYSKVNESTVTFVKAQETLTANQAYLINVEADGDNTFTASGVNVPVTETVGDVFKSNFSAFTMEKGSNLYKLNADGTAFNHSDGGATVGAFRAYLDLSSLPSGPSGAPRRIIHENGGATNLNNLSTNEIAVYSEGGTLIINTDNAHYVQIYSVDGRMIRNIKLEAGENMVNGLAKGLYIVGKQKVAL